MRTFRLVIAYFSVRAHCVSTVMTIALSGRTVFAVYATKHTFAFQVYSSNTHSLPRHRRRWIVSFRLCPFTPTEKSLATHWIGSWVGFTSQPGRLEKKQISSTGIRSSDHPARSLVSIFYVRLTVHLESYLYYKPTQCTIFTLFHYHASTCFGLFLAHNQEAKCKVWQWYFF
jgi:hypothetical protein